MIQRLISQVVRGGTAARGRRPAGRGAAGRRRAPAGGTAGGLGRQLGPMVQRYMRGRR
jgi:hypothetical protein